MVKRGLVWTLKGIVSALAIWWVLRKVDFTDAWAQARGINGSLLLLCMVLLFNQIILGAVRWGMVMRALEAPMPAGRTLSVYYMGAFFTQVATVGGDAIRMLFSCRSGIPLAKSVNSVMLERAITVFGLVVLVAACEPLLLRRVHHLPGAWVFPVLMVVCVLGILVLAALDRLPAALYRWRLVRGMAQLAADTRALCFHPGWGPGTLLVAVLGHANLTLALWAMARGLNISVDVVDCMVLFPPVVLITTLPISIGGLGVREAAMATVFGFVGVPHDSAVVLSLLFFAANVVGALPGGAVFLMSGERRSQVQPLMEQP